MHLRFRSTILRLVFLVLLGPGQVWSGERFQDYFIAPTGAVPGDPTLHTGWTKVGCYDSLTGEWLDCAFTQEILGLKDPATDLSNSGWHAHANHPLIEPPTASMQYDANTCPGQQLKVCGQTQFTGENRITHGIPQASGKIVKKLVIQAPPPNWPPGWVCWFGCDPTFTYIDTFNVEVPGLKWLPDPSPSDFYIKVRGGTDTHPEGHYGTGFTIQTISLIAQNYWVLSGKMLSVNDMSLPSGGMFDLNQQWFVDNSKGNGHLTHRTGTDADINQDGIPCNLDKNLRQAVSMLVPSVSVPGTFLSRSALLCEGGGNKHIDFD